MLTVSRSDLSRGGGDHLYLLCKLEGQHFALCSGIQLEPDEVSSLNLHGHLLISAHCLRLLRHHEDLNISAKTAAVQLHTFHCVRSWPFSFPAAALCEVVLSTTVQTDSSESRTVLLESVMLSTAVITLIFLGGALPE